MTVKKPKKSGGKQFGPVRKVGLVLKHHHPDAGEFAISLCQYLQGKGREVFFIRQNSDIAKSQDARIVSDHEKLISEVDLIIVLGGDGTYLSVARKIKKKSIPILGVNMGQLGFLTEISKEETFDVLGQILDHGKAVISERPMLDVILKRKNKVIFKSRVVNDAVISKGAIARIIGIELSINGQWVNTLRGDGIIVSTPTGSTAYSLAAGGPILDPKLPAMIVTPVCPHSITQRPIVVSDCALIELRLHDRPGLVFLTMDGQDAVKMQKGDYVQIKCVKGSCLKLVSSPHRDYFGLLREKFKFGMRA